MRKRVMGRTGLEVSEVGLGGLFLASDAASYESAKQAVRRAVDLGVTYIDTAPTYGDSEQVLGRILPGARTDGLVISTKLGGRPAPFDPKDRQCLEASLRESLRLLRRDSIDILFIHEPDRPGEYDWWSDQDQFIGPVNEFLEDLKATGIVRYSGIAGTTAYELAHLIRSGQFDIVLTAFNYSALWREAEREILPAAVERGMGIVIGSPLQQGALAVRYDHEVRTAGWLSPPRREQFYELYRLLDEASLSLPELALRFVLSNPAVSCVLTGARSRSQVEQNLRAADIGPLSPSLLERLNAIAEMVPFRPFEEPAVLPFGLPYRGPGPVR